MKYNRVHIMRAFAVLALSFLCAGPTLGFGTPTFTVYFDGPFGGTIEVENAPDMPDGACGMRVNHYDTLSYYWAEYSSGGLGQPMADPPFGPPNSESNPPGSSVFPLFEFTGPFGDDCGSDFVFLGPSTGNHPEWPNGTPQNGGALVFQTLPGSVEWLTESFSVWAEPDSSIGPDPVPVSICQVFPDMCIPPEFTWEDPCSAGLIDCIGYSQAGGGAFQAAQVVSVLLGDLELLKVHPGMAKGLVEEGLLTLDIADERLAEALAGVARVDEQAEAKSRYSETKLKLGQVTASSELARLGLSSCRQEIKGLTGSTVSKQTKSAGPRNRALEVCSAAHSSLETLQKSLNHLMVLGVTREARQ